MTDLVPREDIVDIGYARLFVIAAVDNLCPAFDHRQTAAGQVLT
jgi:hypothetical protein